MGKWKCNSCDYIYSPEKGDISRDIPEGTTFENLSDDWACPKCGSGKDNFKRA